MKYLESEIRRTIGELETFCVVVKISQTKKDWSKGVYKLVYKPPWLEERLILISNDENSNLIVSDSAFVDGEKYQYNSGIISDASVNQNSFADYYVTVNIPTDKIVKYHLKEVRWEYYE